MRAAASGRVGETWTLDFSNLDAGLGIEYEYEWGW